jgi:hypothetical protein
MALDRGGEAEAAFREALRLRPGDLEIQRRLDAAGRRPAVPPDSETPASK